MSVRVTENTLTLQLHFETMNEVSGCSLSIWFTFVKKRKKREVLHVWHFYSSNYTFLQWKIQIRNYIWPNWFLWLSEARQQKGGPLTGGLYVKSPSQNNSLSFLLQKALMQKIRHDYVSSWWEINDVSTYLLLLNYGVDPVMTAYNQTSEVKENWSLQCKVWWYEETEEPFPKCSSSWKSCCIIN